MNELISADDKAYWVLKEMLAEYTTKLKRLRDPCGDAAQKCDRYIKALTRAIKYVEAARHTNK